MSQAKWRVFNNDAPEVQAIRNRKPTRKQIRYYHYLCRELGVPYEAAAQQLITKYTTFGDLEVRIKNLIFMKDFQKMFRENGQKVQMVLWSLGRAIDVAMKQSHAKGRHPLMDPEVDRDKLDLDVKEEYKADPSSMYGTSARGRRWQLTFLPGTGQTVYIHALLFVLVVAASALAILWLRG